MAAWQFDPLENLQSRNPRPPEAVIEAKSVELNLDKPICGPVRTVGLRRRPRRFRHHRRRPAGSDELWRRIGVSLRLLVIGSVIGTIAGVIIGAWGAIVSIG